MSQHRQEPTFHSVQPLRPKSKRAAQPMTELQIGQGSHFSYALPPGWRVAEDGAFALSLVAPDNKAVTVMVGNAGLPMGYPPGQFAWDKLAALPITNLQLGRGRPANPVAGFAQATEFDVTYMAGGVPCRGIARVHMAPIYNGAVMAMTAALSDATQWPAYASWLPSVADLISATNGAAFGMRGIMAQDLGNSMVFAETARRYREDSQRQWQQVTDERNRSVDRRNEEFREALGGVQTYANPYDPGKVMELPTTFSHYWLDRQGNMVGTNDPLADPNVGSTGEWRRLDQRPSDR